jgi:carboxypeptidase family protein
MGVKFWMLEVARGIAMLAFLGIEQLPGRAQSVDGTLTDSVSHVPIPGVIVTLKGPARYDSTTDDAGAFHMGPVRPGKYVLDIVKAGYILPPAQRAAFQVNSDLRLSVEMHPLSLVKGRVLYSDGRPAPRASVWLSAHPTGAARTVTADAGGAFVFDDVKPGQYFLYAAANGEPRLEGEIWAVTYFPSTTDRSAAEPILVVTGVLAAHDIRLRSVPARRIRGIVRDEGGRPANGVTVTLNPSTLGQRAPGQQQTSQTGADGAFDFLAHDGEWRLMAIRKDGDVERLGFEKVSVLRHDVEKVEIRMALPFSVPVIVERDHPPGAGGRRFPMMVILAHADAPWLTRPATGDMLQNVYPGRYRVQTFDGTPGVYLESIKLGEAEVYGLPVEIWDGSLPIRIKYKYGAPVVRGTAGAGEGATVAIVNADDHLVSEDVRTVATGSGGRFEFGNLRPGDYYAVAFDRKDSFIAMPAFRSTVLVRGEKIHLEKGGTVTLNLKIVSWPE